MCRLCKGLKEPTNIAGNLNNIEEIGLPMRSYVSFYCHVDLKSGENRSESVCSLCRLIVETFVAFCYNLSKSELNYVRKWFVIERLGCKRIFSRSQQAPKEEKEIKSEDKEETLVNGSDEDVSRPNDATKDASSFFRRYTRVSANNFFAIRISYFLWFFKRNRPIENVADIYSEFMKQPLLELEEKTHISVEREHLSEAGEISKDWLSEYEIKTWKDFTYSCVNCKKTVKSLQKMLQHCKTSCRINKMLCNLCEKTFSTLHAYVNHVVRKHEMEHLLYTYVVALHRWNNLSIIHLDASTARRSSTTLLAWFNIPSRSTRAQRTFILA